MKALTASQVADLIFPVDQVSKKRDGSGNFIFRKGYFYSHGGSEDTLADRIVHEGKAANLNIEVLDKGNHWAAFNGRASIAKSSHWWVVAKVTQMAA